MKHYAEKVEILPFVRKNLLDALRKFRNRRSIRLELSKKRTMTGVGFEPTIVGLQSGKLSLISLENTLVYIIDVIR